MLDSPHHPCCLEKAFSFPKCMSSLCFQKDQSSDTSKYTFEIQTNSVALPTYFWTQLSKQKSKILDLQYLEALSQSTLPLVLHNQSSISSTLPSLYYITFYHHTEPVGIAAFSITYYHGASVSELLESTRPKLKKWMHTFGVGINPIEGYVLTCGGASTSGGLGFAFTDQISNQEASSSLMQAAHTLIDSLKKQIHISAILFQHTDFFIPSQHARYTSFQTEPNLTLPLSPRWTHFDDYLNDLKSKYRIKAKRADTKSRDLAQIKLTPLLLKKHHQELRDLYTQTVNRSSFKLHCPEIDVLDLLVQSNPESIQVHGYFLSTHLVGFRMSILDQTQLYAHFVGFNPTLNPDHAIYSRMLNDYIRQAIDLGCSQVHFGRTASEIKSTLGAITQPTQILLHHTHPLTNFCLPFLSKRYAPPSPHLHSPFKAQYHQHDMPQ